MRACSAHTQQGTLWPVDAALRPEGKQGRLVRTIRSHQAYYERWAKTWEFQALLKAWVSAGDREVGLRYKEAISPLVWEAASRENFVEDVQAMRRRVEEHVPANEAARQLKLGAGGLRDVEFSVQLLQLVHGRTDPSLRSATTLEALSALAKGGYVARDDAATLDRAYRHLRCLEHRINCTACGAPTSCPTTSRPAAARTDDGAPDASRRGRRRPPGRRAGGSPDPRAALLPAAPGCRRPAQPHEVGLSPEAARERLRALGFRDPAGALRHIEALTTG